MNPDTSGSESRVPKLSRRELAIAKRTAFHEEEAEATVQPEDAHASNVSDGCPVHSLGMNSGQHHATTTYISLDHLLALPRYVPLVQCAQGPHVPTSEFSSAFQDLQRNLEAHDTSAELDALRSALLAKDDELCLAESRCALLLDELHSQKSAMSDQLRTAQTEIGNAEGFVCDQSETTLNLEFRLCNVESRSPSFHNDLSAANRRADLAELSLTEYKNQAASDLQEADVSLREMWSELHSEFQTRLEATDVMIDTLEAQLASANQVHEELQTELRGVSIAEQIASRKHKRAAESLVDHSVLFECKQELALQEASFYESSSSYEEKQCRNLQEQHSILELRFERLRAECSRAASTLSLGDLFESQP